MTTTAHITLLRQTAIDSLARLIVETNLDIHKDVLTNGGEVIRAQHLDANTFGTGAASISGRMDELKVEVMGRVKEMQPHLVAANERVERMADEIIASANDRENDRQNRTYIHGGYDWRYNK